MSEPDAIVFVVDDDATVRDALGRLMRSVDLHCELFSSAEEFLQRERVNAPSCLIVAVRLPRKSGLEFQRELTEKRIHIPIVFLTAYGDIAMSVTAMRCRFPHQALPRAGSAGCDPSGIGTLSRYTPAGGGTRVPAGAF